MKTIYLLLLYNHSNSVIEQYAIVVLSICLSLCHTGVVQCAESDKCDENFAANKL